MHAEAQTIPEEVLHVKRAAVYLRTNERQIFRNAFAEAFPNRSVCNHTEYYRDYDRHGLVPTFVQKYCERTMRRSA